MKRKPVWFQTQPRSNGHLFCAQSHQIFYSGHHLHQRTRWWDRQKCCCWVNVCKGADIMAESDTLRPALLLRPLIIIIISFISETKTLPFGFLKYPVILSDEEKHNHNHRYKVYICLQSSLEALLWQNIMLISQIQNRSSLTSVL